MKRFIAWVVAAVMLMAIPAAFSENAFELNIDENGIVTWSDCEGAAYYEVGYVFQDVDGYTMADYWYETTEKTAVAYNGYMVQITAYDENGNYIDALTGDFYGDPSAPEALPSRDSITEGYAAGDIGQGAGDEYDVQLMYADFDSLNMISYPEDVVPGSLIETESGIEFVLQTYDGRQIRFVGTGVSVNEDGSLVIGKDDILFHKDIIGKVMYINCDVVEKDLRFGYGLGYTFGPDSVENYYDIYMLEKMGELRDMDVSGWQPNFVTINNLKYIYYNETGEEAEYMTVNAITFGYEEGETGLRRLSLYADFYPRLFAGEMYPAELEISDAVPGDYNYVPDFYLIAEPDAPEGDSAEAEDAIYALLWGYTVGDMKDAEGNVVSKTERMPEGATVEVTVGEYTMDVPVVFEAYKGGNTYAENYPGLYTAPVGEVNALVVPIVWADHTDRANEENYNVLLRVFGDTCDIYGTDTQYEAPAGGTFAASEYFDIASYGRMDINFTVTDWYYSDIEYASACMMYPNTYDLNEIMNEVKAANPDADWSKYDRDGDGYIDVVIFVNTILGTDSDSYMRESYAGAFAWTDYPEMPGDPASPGVCSFVTMNLGFMMTGEGNETCCSTVVHEMSHLFGQLDFYDVAFTGINVVGRYDMMSDNVGDWNAFSKYSMGWAEPLVITEEMFEGGAVEFTIGAFAETGDFIVIPAAGREFDGAFSEYIMIDLFTDKGVNRYDAAGFGLEGAAGVRIYHVDARNIQLGTDAEGRSLISNANTNSGYGYKSEKYGTYFIELIQAGGKNTFTVKGEENTAFAANDLFMAGDVFTAEAYSEFMYDGLMNDGSEFGYSVEIVSVTADEAVIRITRQ